MHVLDTRYIERVVNSALQENELGLVVSHLSEASYDSFECPEVSTVIDGVSVAISRLIELDLLNDNPQDVSYYRNYRFIMIDGISAFKLKHSTPGIEFEVYDQPLDQKMVLKITTIKGQNQSVITVDL